jgi:endonuclease G
MTLEDVAAIFTRQRELDPRVIDLARALAAATRIEVELVRHMRFELFPDSDAGLEANLWFSPLVAERDLLGLSLVPECRDELRRQLTLPEHRDTLALAWQVIDRCHRSNDDQPGIPPVVSLQEAITYHSLAGPASEKPQDHRRLMQTDLGTLINALDEDSEGSLTSWVARALPTLPELARTSAAAIALAEKVRARDASIVLENVPRADQDSAQPWVGSTIEVGCQLRTDGIEFSVPPAPVSHIIKLPRTSPLVIEIQTPRFDGWQTRSIEFEPIPESVVPDPSPGSRCRITTATGHRMSLQPTFGSTQPALAVVGLSVSQSSTLAAMRQAVADIGWMVERFEEDAPPPGPTAKAVLLSAPETADGVTKLDTRLIKRLLYSGAPLLAWTARGLEPVRDVLQGATPIAAATKKPVLAVRTNGAVIASSGPSGIELWDATGTDVPSSLLTRAVFSFSFSPDRQRVALVSDDEFLRLWVPGEPEARALQGHRGRLTSVEFSRSGRRLVSTSVDRSAAIWLMDAGAPQLEFWLRHDAAVNHAVFSPDETMVATACEDGTVCVWDLESGRKTSTMRHDAAARSVGWSFQSDRLVVATGKEAHVWALPTLERVSSLIHDRQLQTAAISPNSRRVATLDIEGIARVWHISSSALVLPALDPAAGKNRRVPPLADIHPRTPHGLAFAPDDQSLLVASSGQALMWNTLTPPTPVSSIKSYLLDSVGTLRQLPAMEPENLAALRRQLLAIDERTLQVWEARSATEESAQAVQAQTPASATPPPGKRATRSAVAIIDDGIDVLHETFLDEDGRSRIVAIWDQKDTSGPPPEGFAYGRLHTAEDVAGYVRRQSVPETLGRNLNGHGTHVASVAAGRVAGEFRGGMAPDAAIIAVAVKQDSASILEALSFVDSVASRLRLPMAVSLSADVQSGGRDGKSAFEVGVDEFTGGGRKPGRVVVSPAGNRRGLGTHATVYVPSQSVVQLPWTVEQDFAQVELWGPSENSYRFRLGARNGERIEWIDESRTESTGRFKNGASCSIQFTKRHIDNGDSRLIIRLDKLAGGSKWQLEIEAQRVDSDTPIHAWIDSGPIHVGFDDYTSDEMTIAVPATATSVIAVGAVVSKRPAAATSVAGVSKRPAEPAAFSSRGPTRDLRRKPDVSAPGTEIEGAKGGAARKVIKMSGTSMAAAQVTGIVAMLFEEMATNGLNWPNATQISAALRQTAGGRDGRWDAVLGYGVVDARAFIQAFTGLA